MSEPTPPDDRFHLYLIDGYALIYRAFFAMISRPLTTSAGENTSAPFGLARFLSRLLEDYEPDYIGVVFDAGDSFRTEVHPEYKATREKMPEELEASIPRCRALVEAFRIPVLEVPGWEADDVIGTLAAAAGERGLRTVIVSGDKDFYQLIDDDTYLLNPGRGGPAAVEEEWVTPENAAERLGIPPRQVTDYLALLGDSSDNVPGVPGIGKKTATALLSEYESLDEIIEHVEELNPTRARNALHAHVDQARLSRELVTIRTDAPITLDLEPLARHVPDPEKLRQLFMELEFHSLVRELAVAQEEKKAAEYRLVDEAAVVMEIVAAARSAGRVSITAVGSTGNPMNAELVGLGLAVEPGRGWYLPFGHRPPTVARDESGNPILALEESPADPPANLPSLASGDPSLAALLGLLKDSELPKLGDDLKHSLHLLEQAGAPMDGLAFDTSLASYCLDPGKRRHDLDLLAMERFGHALGARGRRAGLDVAEDPIEETGAAAAEASDYALRLSDVLEEDLRLHEMLDLCLTVEVPLVPVLAGMERVGIKIDLEFFGELRARLRRDIELIREEIFKIAGEEVNLRSVPRLRELLFEKLELPILKKTKTGPSTDESVLMALAEQGHDVPRLIVEHRELDKLDGTYVSKLPDLVHPETGRIHTTFHQAVATTGRLVSSDPNLQNIPIRSEIGRQIRKGFVPEPGRLFIGADYSQIELRVMAHLSQDSAFLSAFREDRDIHRETAARIFGVESETVTSGMRGQAKTINFATIYGQGPVALAAQLGISRSDAREFIDAYFERFSGVRDYLEEMKELARTQGYVETLSGRRRYIPEIRARNPGMRGYGERTATNSPIQGTAADLIKMAMIRLHDRLAEEFADGAHMILQVHDELLFEVREELVEDVARLVRTEMEGAAELAVPLKVDIGIGDSWYSCKGD